MLLFFWFIVGVLWSGAFRIFLIYLTRGTIDIYLWTGCKLGFFLMYFGFNYSSALLIILSIEKIHCFVFSLKIQNNMYCANSKKNFLDNCYYICFYLILSFLIIVKVFSDNYGKYCDYTNVNPQYLYILYSVIIAILYSFGPFIVMTLINIAIICKFMIAKWENRQSGTESTNRALSKSATRGTAMLLTVSFAFIILTGPYCFLPMLFGKAEECLSQLINLQLLFSI